MLRSLKSILPMIVLTLATLSLDSAAIEGGNDRKGRELAKEKCKRCHIKGAEGGTMTALSKTQRQWERFYVKNRHEDVAPGAWSKISDAELKDIMQFMYNHAADSDQPETCGR